MLSGEYHGPYPATTSGPIAPDGRTVKAGRGARDASEGPAPPQGGSSREGNPPSNGRAERGAVPAAAEGCAEAVDEAADTAVFAAELAMPYMFTGVWGQRPHSELRKGGPRHLFWTPIELASIASSSEHRNCGVAVHAVCGGAGS